jgi:hypothetical protein
VGVNGITFLFQVIMRCLNFPLPRELIAPLIPRRLPGDILCRRAVAKLSPPQADLVKQAISAAAGLPMLIEAFGSDAEFLYPLRSGVELGSLSSIAVRFSGSGG